MIRLLLVDDNEQSLYLARYMMEKAGFEATCAFNGKDALEKINANAPDVVVTDILMPVMDGYSLCAKLKNDDHLKHIPLIFVTSIFVESQDKEFGMRLGAEGFIFKTQEPEYYLEELKHLIQKCTDPGHTVSAPESLDEFHQKEYIDALDRILQKKIFELEEANQRLVEIEKKFKAIFNHRFQLTGLLDVDGRLLMANETACSMVGVDSCELEGKFLWQLPHWSHSTELRLEIQNAVQEVKKGTPISFNTSHMDVEGDLRHIEFSLTPVHNDDGELVFIVPEGKDITEKKQSEEKLIASERNYREIYNSSSDAIFIHDAQTGKIIDVNRTMLEMFGYTYQEALRLDIGDISSGKLPFTQEEAYKRVRQAVQEGPQLFEWHCRHKNGDCFWVEAALRNTTVGGKGRVLAVVRNIEQRKQLDSELRLVKHSIEDSAYPFLWIQKDSSFFYVNEASCRSLGYTHEELCSMRVSDIDPDFPDEIWPEFWKKLKTNKSLVFESRHQNKNGDIFPVEITANHLEFEGQEHVFAYVKDISAKIQYEIKQKNLEKQLQQAQKMEAIGTLAGGIAHDFNNILSAIIGYTQLSQMHLDNPRNISEYLDAILKAGNRAGDLVQQILTFSRQTEQELKPISVKLIVKEALKLLRATLPSTIEIRQNLESESLVMGDPTQIHQVVMNLCTNAGYAMQDAGGMLEVTLSDVEFDASSIIQYPDVQPGRQISLTISDTGHGIPADLLDRIFDPFFTTKEKGEGTGMGLAVVHGIVNTYGGMIYAYSEQGHGSTFRVFLPIIDRIHELESAPAENLPKGVERILCIDDEPDIVEIGKQTLESLGYTVISQTSSTEALDLFRTQPDHFDLVITDLTMPKLAGEKLAVELLAIRKDIPIILCTGFSRRITEEKAKELGIKGLLMKPVILSELAKVVRKVLDDNIT